MTDVKKKPKARKKAAPDVQKQLDAEDQAVREKAGMMKCPHCGIDKREIEECQKCKAQEGKEPPRIPGTEEDGEPMNIGASMHIRKSYDRFHMTPQERRDSVSEVGDDGKPKKAGKGGRPPIDRHKALRYLCEAFRLDCTDEEACRYAGISTTWYYDEMKLKDEFSEEILTAKAYPFLVARGAVIGAMETGDNITGLKYLERRDKKRFSPRVEVTGEEGDAIQVDLMSEARKRAGKYNKPKPTKIQK